MPRPRKAPLFELEGQWIAQDPQSPYLHRFWTEPGTGRTRRESLGTTDLAEARRAFAKAVLIDGPKTPDTPLAAVLESYFQGRTDKLPSSSNARLAGKTLLGFFGQTSRVSAAVEAKQKAFAEWSVEQGHSLGYISRNLSVLSAAFGYGNIDSPKIYFGKDEIKQRWTLQTKAKAKRYIPTDDELAKLLSRDDLPAACFRWLVIACLTAARPEAAMEVTPRQRAKEFALLDLNSPGREQNKKYRATVREPKALKGWLDRWEQEMRVAAAKRQRISVNDVDIRAEQFVPYTSIDSVQTALDRARGENRKGPPISAYSIRHKVATVLKKDRVPKDVIDMQLGHARPDDGYGVYSPDYLAPAAKAIEAWWKRLAKRATRELNSRHTPERAKSGVVIKLPKASRKAA